MDVIFTKAAAGTAGDYWSNEADWWKPSLLQREAWDNSTNCSDGNTTAERVNAGQRAKTKPTSPLQREGVSTSLSAVKGKPSVYLREFPTLLEK